MSQNSAVTITEFLEARIAEDETECTPTAAMDDDDRGGWAIHYAERVLAECAAKRAILATFPLPGENNVYGWVERDVLQALAAVYKDHPDYQQEWSL